MEEIKDKVIRNDFEIKNEIYVCKHMVVKYMLVYTL